MFFNSSKYNLILPTHLIQKKQIPIPPSLNSREIEIELESRMKFYFPEMTNDAYFDFEKIKKSNQLKIYVAQRGEVEFYLKQKSKKIKKITDENQKINLLPWRKTRRNQLKKISVLFLILISLMTVYPFVFHKQKTTPPKSSPIKPLQYLGYLHDKQQFTAFVMLANKNVIEVQLNSIIPFRGQVIQLNETTLTLEKNGKQEKIHYGI
jgi:hypothetical protein